MARSSASRYHPGDMSELLTPQFITSVLVIVTMVHVMLLGCAYMIMLERKLSAWIQDRVGPNRVGPKGLLQPIADGLKFILKEEFFPRGADYWLFLLAPTLIIVPSMIGFAIIPWAGELDLSTLPFGLAETFGATGMKAETPGALRAALERGLATAGPVVIEVPVRERMPSPWKFIIMPQNRRQRCR